MKKLIVTSAAALGVLFTVGVAKADPNCVDGAYGVASPAYTTPYAAPYTTPYTTSYVAPSPYATGYVAPSYVAPTYIAPPRVVVAPRLPIALPRPVAWARWSHHGWGRHGHYR